MFEYIRKTLRKIWWHFTAPARDRELPKAAPSVVEAILPLDTDTYTITPRHLREMMHGGKPFVLLDVREEWEYQMVHLEGAISMPFGELLKRFREIKPGNEVIVYCHRGMRSLDAAFLLQQLGFKSVRRLLGGIDRWAQEIDTRVLRY